MASSYEPCCGRFTRTCCQPCSERMPAILNGLFTAAESAWEAAATSSWLRLGAKWVQTQRKEPSVSAGLFCFKCLSRQAEGTRFELATRFPGHHISSVAASHSLTLQARLRQPFFTAGAAEIALQEYHISEAHAKGWRRQQQGQPASATGLAGSGFLVTFRRSLGQRWPQAMAVPAAIALWRTALVGEPFGRFCVQTLAA